MPLSRQLIQVPFGGGLAEQIAESVVPIGKSVVASDAYVAKAGSIEQRPGEETIDAANAPSAPTRVFAHNSEIILADGKRAYPLLVQQGTWRDLDNIYEASIARRIPGERGRAALSADADAVYCNGVYVYVWTDATEELMSVRVVDAVTGSVHASGTTTVDVGYTRLLVVGNKVWLFAFDDPTIKSWVLDTNAIGTGWVASHAIGSVNTLTGYFDIATAGGYVFIAVVTDVGVELVKMTDTVVGWTLSYACLVYSWCAIAASPQKVWLTWVDTTSGGIEGCTFAYSDLTAESTFTLEPASIGADITRLGGITDGAYAAVFAWEYYDALTRYAGWRAVASTAVEGFGGRCYHVGLLSRPMYRSSRWYAVLWKIEDAEDTAYQRHAWLCELGFNEVPEEPA